MPVVLVLLAAVFGSADQYLGSLASHPWATEVSLLAAPWLLLPLLVGYSQRTPGRAVALACVCTGAALLGYLVMTLSPVEQAKVSVVGVTGLLRGQLRWFLLGAISSPLLGWLGHRWRTGESRWVPLLAAAGICLEPYARSLVGQPIRYAPVRLLEVLAGLCLALCAAAWWALRARPARSLAGATGR